VKAALDPEEDDVTTAAAAALDELELAEPTITEDMVVGPSGAPDAPPAVPPALPLWVEKYCIASTADPSPLPWRLGGRLPLPGVSWPGWCACCWSPAGYRPGLNGFPSPLSEQLSTPGLGGNCKEKLEDGGQSFGILANTSLYTIRYWKINDFDRVAILSLQLSKIPRFL
jgi:hypothetical protein